MSKRMKFLFLVSVLSLGAIASYQSSFGNQPLLTGMSKSVFVIGQQEGLVDSMEPLKTVLILQLHALCMGVPPCRTCAPLPLKKLRQIFQSVKETASLKSLVMNTRVISQLGMKPFIHPKQGEVARQSFHQHVVAIPKLFFTS